MHSNYILELKYSSLLTIYDKIYVIKTRNTDPRVACYNYANQNLHTSSILLPCPVAINGRYKLLYETYKKTSTKNQFNRRS